VLGNRAQPDTRHPARVVQALAWGLIYIARALEWTRIHWNTIWLDSAFQDLFWNYGKSRGVVLFTRLGRAVLSPVVWMYPASVGLTRLANRGLPPLPLDEYGEQRGFLTRLYGDDCKVCGKHYWFSAGRVCRHGGEAEAS
jgi:hypothetical protein